MKRILSGNEAIALGAYHAGVKVACAYPGTPSTEILENLAQFEGVYAEWSTNEKVAMEVALGASYGGVRAMASMKMVGLNVAADPFLGASVTGINGGLVVVDSLDEALALANEYAPEHLCLMTADSWPLVSQIRHAGALFLGSPEAIGDYIAGPSHVLPTGGTARFSSPLGVEDFLKVTSLVALNAQALRKLGPAAARIARAEGLTAHALAIEARLNHYKL